MNNKTKSLIGRIIKSHTAFRSFSELVNASLNHGYTPSLYPWKRCGIRHANAVRALARQYDLAMEEAGSSNRAYRGGDA